MTKSQKELAFLRDLTVQTAWTERFTDFVDKHLDLLESENLLYINAGTGSHALAIGEKVGDKTDIFATCEDEDLLTIAQDKAVALSSEVEFSMFRFDDDAFDTVVADATFVRPTEIERFVAGAVRVASSGGDVAIFLPSAGSFGEIFSLLWEVLFNQDLAEHGAAVENLISDIPTVGHIESIAERSGLVNIKTVHTKEVFEYDNGAEFVESPLIADFLLPTWLEMLEDNDKELVRSKLADLIDLEDSPLTFGFSVKATLLKGTKG